VRQVDEYTHLKEKLEKEVHELRKREQQLTLGEQQVCMYIGFEAHNYVSLVYHYSINSVNSGHAITTYTN
jgi:hypothetical protein